MSTDPTAGESLEQFALDLAEVWGDAIAAYLERMAPFIRSLAELAKDPQVQAAIAARQFGDAVREYRPCHCLCGRAHPSARAVCDMSAVTSRRYDSPSLGPVDVPLCAPCAAAQGISVPPSRTCGHCGRDGARASANGVPLCHTDDPGLPDCYRRVTVYHEQVGALLGDGPKPGGVRGIVKSRP